MRLLYILAIPTHQPANTAYLHMARVPLGQIDGQFLTKLHLMASYQGSLRWRC